jgi:hypothetical protein
MLLGRTVMTAETEVYIWGLVGNRGPERYFKVPDAAVDAHGHCCFPALLQFPKGQRKGREFVAAAADDGSVFALLDQQGGVWAWGKPPFAPAVPTLVINDGAVGVDVGSHFLVAAMQSGEAVLLGTIGGAKSAARGGEPERSPPSVIGGIPAGAKVTAVAACNATCLLLTDRGEVFSIGDELVNGTGSANFTLAALPIRFPGQSVSITRIALGSRHAATIANDGSIYCWGDGLSGNFGMGDRQSSPVPVHNPFFAQLGVKPLQISCTRGQPGCKRNGTARSCGGGQEGPRLHVVTSDGALWIAGTTHKGLAADHLTKTMQPDEDHLSFYRVGGKAKSTAPPCYTGAAEDLSKADMAPAVARRMGMADVSAFGQNGTTGYLSATHVMWSQPSHIHSLALSDDGRLFAWGCGSDGRTGLQAFMRGPGGSKRTLKCYVSTPSVVEALEHRTVIAGAGGKWWSIAIVATARSTASAAATGAAQVAVK